MTPPFGRGPGVSPRRGLVSDEDWFVLKLWCAALYRGAAPIFGPWAVAFLKAHPGIRASAFWSVANAIRKKQNPVTAGAKAGLDTGTVMLIENVALAAAENGWY